MYHCWTTSSYAAISIKFRAVKMTVGRTITNNLITRIVAVKNNLTINHTGDDIAALFDLSTIFSWIDCYKHRSIHSVHIL